MSKRFPVRRGAARSPRRRGASLAAALLALALTTACARGAAGAGAASAPSPGARFEGLWRVAIAVGERATYSGTLSVARQAEALSGVLRLTSPITVDANLSGTVTDGVMTLSGNYTAGNGCTGTIRVSAGGAQPPLQGPTELQDRCAGRLMATASLQR
jgi:hypothetical protein